MNRASGQDGTVGLILPAVSLMEWKGASGKLTIQDLVYTKDRLRGMR